LPVYYRIFRQTRTYPLARMMSIKKKAVLHGIEPDSGYFLSFFLSFFLQKFLCNVTRYSRNYEWVLMGTRNPLALSIILVNVESLALFQTPIFFKYMPRGLPQVFLFKKQTIKTRIAS